MKCLKISGQAAGWLLALTFCILVGCRGELPVLPSEAEEVAPPADAESNAPVKGFYLLNEGNMGSNKCTLDYFDYATGKYHRNIYAENNPGVVKELGDVGNDIGKIDTLTLQPLREVVVGYQPEEMVIADGKLYVANSGGYRFPNYDRTVSVIDLETFQVVKTIDVAINLHRMEIDRFGRIYVSSRGDYYGVGSDVYVIDSKTDQVTGSLGLAASEMCLCGDSLYLTSVEWSYVTESNTVGYALYDVQKQEIVKRNFITDGTDKQIKVPYGIAVNPDTREFLVTDATDYVTPGYLYCYSPEGRLKWRVRTGDIPAHFVFTTESVLF